jgi:multicomponent Na+:H+ antiporter subunit G
VPQLPDAWSIAKLALAWLLAVLAAATVAQLAARTGLRLEGRVDLDEVADDDPGRTKGGQR